MCFFLIFIISPALLFAVQHTEITTGVKDHIRKRVDSGESVGIVVGVIDAGGERFFCYGRKSINGTEKVDEHTIFEIGSVSKVFTSLLLVDFVMREELNLTDPIEKYLPASVEVPERNGKKITFEDLVTHFSGLPHIPANLDLNNMAEYSNDDLYTFLSGYTLTRDIGSQFQYSGTGVGLIGHILTLISGQSYEQLIVSRVCNALGMESIRVNLDSLPGEKLSRGHYNGEEVPYYVLPISAQGAGSLKSSAGDLLKFLKANTGLSKTNLSEAMNLCHHPRRTISGSQKIGLAWFLLNFNNEEFLYHAGNTNGFGSFCGFSKEKRIGVVVLSNSHPGVSDIGFHILTDGSYELNN